MTKEGQNTLPLCLHNMSVGRLLLAGLVLFWSSDPLSGSYNVCKRLARAFVEAKPPIDTSHMNLSDLSHHLIAHMLVKKAKNGKKIIKTCQKEKKRFFLLTGTSRV